ncbi:MAG: cell division protein ZapA [Agarilytica sp.]
MSEASSTYVSILDKEYQVACPEAERPALNHAASELDKRMRAIRASGSIIGLERIAVMTALNLCHELQQANQSGPSSDNDTLDRIAKKLEDALEDT